MFCIFISIDDVIEICLVDFVVGRAHDLWYVLQRYFLCIGEASCNMRNLRITKSTQPILPTDQLRVVRVRVGCEVASTNFKFEY